MEISSVDSMTSLMNLQALQRGSSTETDESDTTSSFLDALDSDGDGSLSKAEFSASGGSESSEVFDILDTNEDGVVSQDELDADKQSNSGIVKAAMEAGSFGGIQQNGDTEGFQQLMDMVGENSGESRSEGAERYSQMQESMIGGSDYINQSVTGGLDLTA
ncbi:EF-hand domain-containing protein [Pseudodesulfovibrio sediminis]|uniref:EF-hand domain-containing protein n=1 Tax=Pseudodesulfovibrio sediminis TaxID=2810563 RepID=A0ABM7P4G3_9BACT|nr:EF-hand domain-containing protein [Pseudodesulfovibrio sediminis]BCS87655.1 hypothetical protein PSDVSF_08970 [Pseudodesulfovibrio sediminis]